MECVMSEHVGMEPRLFAGDKDRLDPETLVRVNAVISFQNSISYRPEEYATALEELGPEATADTLDLHDFTIATRDAIRDPKKKIKEFFAKRGDQVMELDKESDEAIFSTPEFKELSEISQRKTSTLIKKGVFKAEIRANPEAREASNAVRRYIVGAYIGRVVTWKAQLEAGKVNQAV
jgi:hypothetical protein